MVEVTVFFEGGSNQSTNSNAETVDNSNKLRIAFSKLLNSGLQNPNIRIVARPIGSINNVKSIAANLQNGEFILIDLDDIPSKRKQRIHESGLSTIINSVFFMVQAMEAWILSQPEVIDRTFASMTNNKSKAENDHSLADRHPENIHHPDRLLQAILARHFEQKVAGKTKKLVYGKLKHAPELLQNLDIQKLKETFQDVKLLLEKVVNGV